MNHEITLEELEPQIARREATVVEALPFAHYAGGHLPGAVNLPLDAVAKAASVLPDREAAIVVYCAGPTCKNSDVAADRLRALGYARVRVFRGGKAAWKDAGLALEVAS